MAANQEKDEKFEAPNNNMAEMNKKQKKQMADKKYRDKQKEQKRERCENLTTLGEQNKRLKSENQSLHIETDGIKNDLDSANATTKKLRIEFSELKNKMDVKDKIVNSCSERFIKEVDLEDEHKKLKIRFGILSESSTSKDCWEEERKEILNKIKISEDEEKKLIVQVKTLSHVINKTKGGDDG
ncbi:hypothetical protein ACFE04_030142 [Oxalis oulophora]